VAACAAEVPALDSRAAAAEARLAGLAAAVAQQRAVLAALVGAQEGVVRLASAKVVRLEQALAPAG
jgi:hypothetical protein